MSYMDGVITPLGVHRKSVLLPLELDKQEICQISLTLSQSVKLEIIK